MQTSWLCFMELQLLLIEISGYFGPLWTYDIDLNLLSFIYELDPYLLDQMCKNELLTLRLSKAANIQTTYSTEIICQSALQVASN